MLTVPAFLLGAVAVIGAGAAAVAIAEAVRRPRGVLEERGRAELKRKAPTDAAAARALREALLRDLERQSAVRRDLERDRGRGEGRAALLRDIERAEQATRAELAQVELWIGAGR
jgi:hypothetical protein